MSDAGREIDREGLGREAKFNIGQVVMMVGLKKPMPFIILDKYLADGEWFYFWNRWAAAAEYMIRALTPKEMGQRSHTAALKAVSRGQRD